MQWTDKQGRDWCTAINVSTVRRVKHLTGVLLTDAADSDLLERLYNDCMLLADVLYAVCEPQAKARDIDSAAFGELLSGELIDKACESLMRDLVDFFPSGRRPAVETIWKAAKRVETERVKMLDQKLTDERFELLLTNQMQQASDEIDRRLAVLGGSSGRSLEQSELTQGR